MNLVCDEVPEAGAMTSNDKLLTAAEVADLLAVPVRWVREHTRNGLIPCIRLGHYVRYERDEILVWVRDQRAGGAQWRKHRPRGGG